MLDQPLALGHLTLPGRALLAPLAGVTDVPFRRICQELGASLTYVEMLSAVAVLHESRTTMNMLARHADEPLLGVQVTGKTPGDVARAVAILHRHGFDTIDINMGCPVRKIVGSGSGSAIMRDVQVVMEMVRLCRQETDRPLSVKCRLGFSRAHRNVNEVAAAVASAGANMLTVHGRTRDDGYQVPAERPPMRAAFEAARRMATGPLVLVGNGDIMNCTSAHRTVVETGCDAVMVSRGALGNPWLFREVLTGQAVRPTVGEWEEVVLRHLAYHEAAYADTPHSACQLRKHLIWYTSGFRGANKLRQRFNSVASIAEARECVRTFAAGLPPDYRRFDDNQPSDAAAHDPKYDMDRTADRGVGDDGLVVL